MLLLFTGQSARKAYWVDGDRRQRLRLAVISGVITQVFEIFRLPGVFIALLLIEKR